MFQRLRDNLVVAHSCATFPVVEHSYRGFIIWITVGYLHRRRRRVANDVLPRASSRWGATKSWRRLRITGTYREGETRIHLPVPPSLRSSSLGESEEEFADSSERFASLFLFTRARYFFSVPSGRRRPFVWKSGYLWFPFPNIGAQTVY